ncbi:calcineurin-like phosphoesterase [Nitzschia inconspicua]|uniref:Calcineurin-like phosphoesterase n=2 Tax=Nitzschia inconspicua TaxID=303405 RepID=A0A9K3PEI9_9STRA|nr:calcineurin-like phosphoesterase [Nitzschia inconspicua]
MSCPNKITTSCLPRPSPMNSFVRSFQFLFTSSTLLFPFTVQSLSSTTSTSTTRTANNNHHHRITSRKSTDVVVPHHLRSLHGILDQFSNQNHNNINDNNNSNHCIFIDMENVRGKSGFELSHQQVLDRTALWMDHFSLQDQVVVVIDHGGDVASAYYKQPTNMAITFSGNHAKADDVIANGVATANEWISSSTQQGTLHSISKVGKMVVVTADHELQARCRRATKLESLHIVEPQTFLDDLEWVQLQQQQQPSQVNGSNNPVVDNVPVKEQIKLGRLDAEIRLRGQLLDAEMQLDRKRSGKYMTKKRRKKLESTVQALRRKLALRGPSLLEQLTATSAADDTLSESSDSSDLTRISREEQDELLARWRELQHRTTRKEQTGDRIIYAERLRRQLEEDDNAVMLVHEGFEQNEPLPSAKAFVRFTNQAVLRDRQRRQDAQGQRGTVSTHMDHVVVIDQTSVEPPEISTEQRLAYENQKKLDTLDLVVISDTHGFEGQFDLVPSGDVLLHLGDFALEGSTYSEQRGLAAFDHWLARQPHDYKIVIRGNHDPFQCDFPLSKAMYVTEPKSVNLGGFEMALVPHGVPRKLAASGGIPPTCDVIASHLPPYRTLDRTCSGKFAGSSFLCNVVRGMPLGPPPLWLVGHIHEGRGVARRQFGRHKDHETMVINAANANHGRATHLTHGPVAVRLKKDDPNPQILTMDDMSINQTPIYNEFFNATNTNVVDGNGNHLLMAVDLGLKSGISLFNSQGNLVRYEQFQFHRDTLEQKIPSIIEQWEQQAGDGWKVTHIAIEGGDTALLAMWERVTPDISTLRVRPEEWRSELLTAKENKNGASAKAASRLIARQMVQDFGTMEHHTGKFQTDVAEAVLLGTHVARRLGWIQRDPAVRRYTNGNVVTPRKTVAVK